MRPSPIGARSSRKVAGGKPGEQRRFVTEQADTIGRFAPSPTR